MRIFAFFLYSCILLWNTPLRCHPVHFCVIIPSYNNENYLEGNLQSLYKQTYPYWRAIYINDCSTDKTRELADAFIARHALQDRITIIHNTQRKRALYNHYTASMMASSKEVIVHLDGDDELLYDTVLEDLAKVYEDPNVWVAYAGYVSHPKGFPNYCKPWPKSVLKSNSFRNHAFVCVGLRSFYADLFHQIRKEDLMYQGEFFPICADRAIMYPILEMASKGHIKYIKRPLYLYNVGSPLNWFNNKEGKLDARVTAYLTKKMTRYTPLNRAPWESTLQESHPKRKHNK